VRSFILAVAFCLCLSGAPQLRAYSLLDSSWLLGTYVGMHLDLGPTTVRLQDGSATWAASAADAVQVWDTQLTALRLVPISNTPTSHASGDHYSSVFFSPTIFGQSCGTDALAVTVRLSNVTTKTSLEADVLVNQNKHFNSYRGPLQFDTAIGDYIYDIHRVFLHEFGHVLGLDHPDQHGQAVDAIMNSVIGDRDSLSSDDIAAGRSLYSSLHTQAPLGTPYSFTIKAAPTVTHLTASGLPPEITLNPTSGIISGIPTVRGRYSALITLGEAGTTLQFTLNFQTSTPVASAGIIKANLKLQAENVIADPVRPQVYVTLPLSNSVGIFSTSSLTVTKNSSCRVGPASRYPVT
jgi:Matrixin